MTVYVDAYLSPRHINRRENTWHRYGGEYGAVADSLAGFFLELDLEGEERRSMAWSPQ